MWFRWERALSASLAILFVSSLFEVKVLLACKFFVDTLAPGASGTKTLACLGFLTLLFALRHWSLPHRPWFWKGTGLTLLAGFTFSTVEYIIYCYRTGAYPFAWSAVSCEGTYSSSSLFHIHVPKVLVAELFRYQGNLLDAGYPFLSLIPKFLIYPHLIFYLTSTALLILSVLHFSQNLRPGHCLALYLSAFCIVKAGIDGGPLAPELWMAGNIFLYLFGRSKTLKWFIPLSACVYLLGLATVAPELRGRQVILILLPLLTTLICPLLVQKLWDRSKRGPALALGLAGFLVLVMIQVGDYNFFAKGRFSVRTLSLYGYGQNLVPKGHIFTIVSRRELSLESSYPSFQLQKEIPCNTLKLYRGTMTADATIFEICSQAKANLLRRAVSGYRKPTYFSLKGKFVEPLDPAWPHSKVVRNYRIVKEGEGMYLEMKLLPGSDLNLAVDSLPTSLMRWDTFAITYKPTDHPGPWRFRAR